MECITMNEALQMYKGRSESQLVQPWAVEFTTARIDGQPVVNELMNTFWKDILMLAESRGLKLQGGIKLEASKI